MAIWVEAQSIAYNIQGANLSPEHFANKKSEEKKHTQTHMGHTILTLIGESNMGQGTGRGRECDCSLSNTHT